MTDNLENVDVQPEAEKVGIDESNTDELVQESQDESSEDSTPPGEKSEEKSQKIEMTRDELNANAARIRETTERKVKLRLERDKQEEIAKIKAEYEAKSQQTTQPSNSFWDETLNKWIPKSISIADYEKMAKGEHVDVQQKPSVSEDKAKPKSSDTLTIAAQDQAIDLDAEIEDFTDVITSAPITVAMANEAASSPNGLKNLYELQKTNPTEVYKISRLPVDEQRRRVWKLNAETKVSLPRKLKTNATAPAEKLSSPKSAIKSFTESSSSELEDFFARGCR